MKNILDTFFELWEEIKQESGVSDPIRNIYHPLNSVVHPLKSVLHPYRSVMHPLNSIANPRRGVERFRALRDLINEHILHEGAVQKQSSSKLSTLAARVMNGYNPTHTEIKSLAASVLSQDETVGQRRA